MIVLRETIFYCHCGQYMSNMFRLLSCVKTDIGSDDWSLNGNLSLRNVFELTERIYILQFRLL